MVFGQKIRQLKLFHVWFGLSLEVYMKKRKQKVNNSSKKITRYVGKTKMEKENEEALRIIRSIKGMFG